MKLLRNIFMIVMVLVPVAGFATRDDTLDYECRPRWDRFVVDADTTNWDKNSIACYDKYGNEIDPSKLYGAPKMYGEYEGGGQNAASALYGTQQPTVDYNRMYGKYDPNQPGIKPQPKPQPVRVAAPAPKTSESKEVVKPKPVAPKPKPQPKPQPKPKVESVVVAVIPVESEPAPAPKPVAKAPVQPSVPAQNIAKSINEKFITEESYCTEINPPVLGPLPKGLVLMPGRTDMMSCVRN